MTEANVKNMWGEKTGLAKTYKCENEADRTFAAKERYTAMVPC